MLDAPGAHDPMQPAQSGDTDGAGEARLLAGTNFTVWSTPGFVDAQFGYPPAHRRAVGRIARGLDPRPQIRAAHISDSAGFHHRRNRVDKPQVSDAEGVRGRGERGLGLDDRWSVQFVM